MNCTDNYWFKSLSKGNHTLLGRRQWQPTPVLLAWKIPRTEEPGKPQSMGSLGVRHDWVTSLSCIGEGNGNPLQCSWLENPRDGGAWWAAVYGVSQSRTWLKRLSSSSSKVNNHYFKVSILWDKAIWFDFTTSEPNNNMGWYQPNILNWWFTSKTEAKRKIPHAYILLFNFILKS